MFMFLSLSPDWFEVGGALLETDDVTHFVSQTLD